MVLMSKFLIHASAIFSYHEILLQRRPAVHGWYWVDGVDDLDWDGLDFALLVLGLSPPDELRVGGRVLRANPEIQLTFQCHKPQTLENRGEGHTILFTCRFQTLPVDCQIFIAHTAAILYCLLLWQKNNLATMWKKLFGEARSPKMEIIRNLV